jgi:hypothetical protein
MFRELLFEGRNKDVLQKKGDRRIALMRLLATATARRYSTGAAARSNRRSKEGKRNDVSDKVVPNYRF